MELSGGDKLAKVLESIGKKMHGSVRVGFLEGSTYSTDGMSIPTVAFWNEFGTSRIPARPFFRTTIKDKESLWGNHLVSFAKIYDYDGPKVLDAMGEIMAQDIQATITGWTDPRNADSTIARKGFNAPLRDTNEMHDAVKHVVSE